MFKRQLNLLVMAVILLSPALAYARDLEGERNVSAGNIHIHTDRDGNVNIQTPNIKINTPTTSVSGSESLERRIAIDRHRQSYRYKYKSTLRRRRANQRYIPPQAIDDEDREFDRRTSIIRGSTISSESRIEQHSIQCGSGSVISSQQSTQVINGRSTVRSQVYTNCH